MSFGHAMIVSPWGDVLVDCGEEDGEGEGLIKTAWIDLDLVEDIRRKMPCGQHRRKDIISKI
jgi:deaminated glutathione amidase